MDLRSDHLATAAALIDPPAHEPLSVILGADSLSSARSGVGRVTFEVGQALRRSAGVSLRLWIGDQLVETGVLDGLAAGESPIPLPQPRPLRILLGGLPGVQPVRAVIRKRRMRGSVRTFAAPTAGRVVYHETNMIMKPFGGVGISHVHDLSWLHCRDMHPADRLRWIDDNIKRTLRDAARFVSVSHFTANCLAQEFGIARDRIDVVANAASESFRPRSATQARETLARHGLQDRGYVLSVSTLEPRKNFDRLLAAHLSLPPRLRARFPLAIVGGSGWGVTLDNRVAERAQRDGTLRLLGRLPDEELVDVTARAACFAYVSLYEGFGLPVLEGMATGVPVVASSTTATGETAGDAALLVDPTSVEEIGACLAQILDDPALAQALGRKGVARAAEFGWDRTAEGLIDCWAKALG